MSLRHNPNKAEPGESGPHHEISDDHCGEEERNTDERRAVHAVPHGLDPLAAQHPKHDHERVEKVAEVPQRHGPRLGEVVRRVVGSEQLHSHHGEDEDDDGQHEAEVTQRSERPSDDAHQKVQRRPRLG